MKLPSAGSHDVPCHSGFGWRNFETQRVNHRIKVPQKKSPVDSPSSFLCWNQHPMGSDFCFTILIHTHGVHSHGGYPYTIHIHPFSLDFPWNQPSIFGVPPWRAGPPRFCSRPAPSVTRHTDTFLAVDELRHEASQFRFGDQLHALVEVVRHGLGKFLAERMGQDITRRHKPCPCLVEGYSETEPIQT